jgi:CubicO group peptidase (beta-lactamase class C family)
MKKELLLIILTLFCFIEKGSAQSVNQKVESFIRSQMKTRKIPGMQVAVVRHGKIVFSKSFGIANLEDSVAVTNKTLFPVHSITKAFVGVAAMQLVEAGKLKLHDPISAYLNDLPLSWQKITVHQLLTHMSGLPDIWDKNSVLIDINEDSALAKVFRLPVTFQPGEKFQYNQTNYVLIGMIINKLTGMSFVDFIKQNQFIPAGMKHSCFGDDKDIVANLSGSYQFRQLVHDSVITTDTLRSLIRDWPKYLWTAVGLNTSANELANWTIKLQEGKLIKKESLQTLWKPALLNDGTHEAFGPVLNGYALGWPIAPREDHPVAGPTGGGRAAFFIYQKDDLTVIVLTNLIFSAPQRYIDDIAGFYIPIANKYR